MTQYVGIVKQDDQSTAGTPTSFINVESFTPRLNNQPIADEGIAGIEDLKHSRGNLDAGGEYSFRVSPENIGLTLGAVMGSCTSAQQETTDAYLHTFKNAATLNWFTVQAPLTSETLPFTGCVFDSLEFSMGENENMSASASFTATTLAEPATLETASFDSKDWFGKGSTGTVSVNSTTTYTLKSWNLSIENTLDKDYAVNSYTLSNADKTRVQVSGSFDMIYNEDVYEMFLGADAATTPQATLATFPLDFKWEGATIASTYKDTLEFDIGSAYIEDVTPSQSRGNRNILTVNWRAIYNSSDASSLVVKLTNETASYTV
jgi:hypothetical protein